MDYVYAIKRTNNKDARFLDEKINSIRVLATAIAKVGITINPFEHSHSYYELHCVTEGSCTFVLSGVAYKVKKYDFFLIPPNTPHFIEVETEDFSKLAISFRMSSKYSHFSLVSKIVHPCDSNERKLLEFLMNYEERSIGGDVAISYLIVKSLLIQFLFEDNAKIFNPYFSLAMDDDAIVHYLRQYISENCFSCVSPQDVADYCGISQRHLNRVLHQKLGGTIRDIIDDEKLKQIKNQIKDGLTAKQIASNFGYANEFSLLRFVKNKTGKTFGDFRIEEQQRQ